jgi:hypothetical protein
MEEEVTLKKAAKYRTKKKVREYMTEKLEGVILPALSLHDQPALEVRRGKKKKVVEDFHLNPKAQTMGEYIKQGLSPMEAGILAGFAPEQLQELQKLSDTYRRFVERKLIEFKQSHLQVISNRSDPKMSQWLLERSFPQEFGTKVIKNSDSDGSSTVIAAIFRTVQRQQDNTIPTEYVDVTGQEEEQGHNAGENNRAPQPSLEPGGANII